MAIPIIESVSDSERPFWSVMIPTYRPKADYLERAISSVLAELTPGAQVQIEIVDDASPEFDAAPLLRRIGADGIVVSRNAERLGIAANWNACIARARGRWLHLLHQDDFVRPGFYEAMRLGIESVPDLGAAFSDCVFVSPDGLGRRHTLIRRGEPGVLREWIQHVFVQLAIQTPAIVVRRDVYEALGGYDDRFAYVLDWDMWKRIAARYPVWYEPRPLACYQRHRSSQTAKLRRTGRNIAEIADCIDRSSSLLDPGSAARIARGARRAYALFSIENVFESLLGDRDVEAAAAQWREARRLAPAADLMRALARLALRSTVQPFRARLDSSAPATVSTFGRRTPPLGRA
jgi:glycosyltransferase involved in cell wall biosynthesis